MNNRSSGLRSGLLIRHSPSSRTETELASKMLRLGRWERFCKGVSHHIFGRTINELEFAFVDDPANVVKTYVNVFCSGMVLVVFQQRDRRLVVRVECCCVRDWAKDFGDKGM
jgi:hypothetical protein